MSNVVLLRDGSSLADVPGRLRALADAIERGDHGEIRSLLAVIPRGGDWPLVFGFGDVGGDDHPVVVLETAKAWFVANVTRRS